MQKVELNYSGTYIQTCRGMIKIALLISVIAGLYFLFQEVYEVGIIVIASSLVSFWVTMLLCKAAEGVLILRTLAELELKKDGKEVLLQD
jgi:hypothetical protein